MSKKTNLTSPMIQKLQKEEEEESSLPMLHGKATDALACMNSRGKKVNPISGELNLVYNDVEVKISGFNDIAGALGISTHKLLSTAISEFTRINNVGNSGKKWQDLSVSIPLKEYALLRKYDITEHEASTPEERKKEKKRAENELRNARRNVRKDLEILRQSTISWKEKVKGKDRDFMDIGFIGSKGIEHGYIYMSFTQEMGDYLIELPLTQYPRSLLGVDERNPNAYPMGLKMTEHYNMDNNLKQGTANLLRVSTLLNCTKLPGINDGSVKKHGWRERIKEPFEKALDVLTISGVLEDWYYSHKKGEVLTNEEAANFNSFESWNNTLVYFTLKDAPDHTDRLKAREEEKAQEEKKASKEKKSSGKKK